MNLFVFTVTLGLHCCARAFSGCGERASGCIAQALSAWASVAADCGSWNWGSVAAVHGLSCSVACGIFLDQGLNPCSLHCPMELAWPQCPTQGTKSRPQNNKYSRWTVLKKNYLKNRSRYRINPGIDFYKMACFSSNCNPIKTHFKGPSKIFIVLSGITLNGQSITIF